MESTNHIVLRVSIGDDTIFMCDSHRMAYIGQYVRGNSEWIPILNSDDMRDPIGVFTATSIAVRIEYRSEECTVNCHPG